MTVYVSLSGEDFETLTSGGEVEKNGAKIILQDIGFSQMATIINTNYRKLLTKQQNA